MSETQLLGIAVGMLDVVPAALAGFYLIADGLRRRRAERHFAARFNESWLHWEAEFDGTHPE
jgi:hypothetical protein